MEVFITILQSIGLFLVDGLIYGLYPQNTIMSWLCFIWIIALIYVFVTKSKTISVVCSVVYFVVGVLIHIISFDMLKAGILCIMGFMLKVFGVGVSFFLIYEFLQRKK